MADVGFIVAIINLIVGISILIMGILAYRKFTELAFMKYVTILFVVAAITFVAHGAIEVFGIGEDPYAITALIVTVLVGIIVGIMYKQVYPWYKKVSLK